MRNVVQTPLWRGSTYAFCLGFYDDEFSVFSRNSHRAVSGGIELINRRKKIPIQSLLAVIIENQKGLVNGAIKDAEEIDKFFWCPVS